MKKARKFSFEILGLALVLILLNFFASKNSHRFDLTADKRYTLSDDTKKVLGQLKMEVYCQFYLKGASVPTRFRNIKDEAERLLWEYAQYTKGRVKFIFVDPRSGKNKSQNEKIMEQLQNAGVPLMDLTVKKNDGVVQSKIFTGGFMRYGEKQVIINLFKNAFGASDQEATLQSIQELEYVLTNGIKTLLREKKEVIAFLEGHGELTNNQIVDVSYGLAENFKVRRLLLDENLKKLDSLAAIVIARPKKPFSETDKFLLDQYVMNGGKLIWLIDKVTSSFESLEKTGVSLCLPLDLNIDDMTFKYGIRFEDDLIADAVQCASIPVLSGTSTQNPQQLLLPWTFSLFGEGSSTHPVSQNLNIVRMDFAGSMFSVENGLKKTSLLQTSPYTKNYKINLPVEINLQMLKKKINEKEYKNGIQTLAYLVEGKFPSLYDGRKPPINIPGSSQKDMSEQNSMVFISDGDMVKNNYDTKRNQYFPLGYDKYLRQTFGNKDFMVNIVNYLIDTDNLLSIKNRTYKIRLLDTIKSNATKTKWIFINTLAPIFLLLVFGVVRFFVRKNLFAKRITMKAL